MTPTTVTSFWLDLLGLARSLGVRDVEVLDSLRTLQEVGAPEPPSGEEGVVLPGLGEVGEEKALLASRRLTVGDVEVLVGAWKRSTVGERAANGLAEVLEVLDEGGSQAVTLETDDHGQPQTVALVDVGEGDEDLMGH